MSPSATRCAPCHLAVRAMACRISCARCLPKRTCGSAWKLMISNTPLATVRLGVNAPHQLTAVQHRQGEVPIATFFFRRITLQPIVKVEQLQRPPPIPKLPDQRGQQAGDRRFEFALFRQRQQFRQRFMHIERPFQPFYLYGRNLPLLLQLCQQGFLAPRVSADSNLPTIQRERYPDSGRCGAASACAPAPQAAYDAHRPRPAATFRSDRKPGGSCGVRLPSACRR